MLQHVINACNAVKLDGRVNEGRLLEGLCFPFKHVEKGSIFPSSPCHHHPLPVVMLRKYHTGAIMIRLLIHIDCYFLVFKGLK